MKNLIRSILMVRNKPDRANQICNHNRPEINENQIKKSLIFLSKDYCKTCDKHMCNICSSAHILQHCKLSLGINRNLGEGLFKDFNYGYLMKANISGIKCICGIELNPLNLNHAMCAACGLLSCSDECHRDWEKIGNCTYHTNFFQPNYKNNLRSIRLSNILNIQISKIKRWSIAQKTSLSLISCYASKIANHVYLQRGFRNYGKPQDELIERFQKVPFGIDFTTHIQRLCDCVCKSCQSRQAHSAGNCEYQCSNNITQPSQSYILDEVYHEQCQCSCSFCSSGIVLDTHMKINCFGHCYQSQFYRND